jgi:Proteolysis_6 C-terminal
MKNGLTESVVVVDTDLRKQQEADRVTASVYPHKLPGLNIISGVGMSSLNDLDARRPPLASPMDLRHLLATSSFRAPLAPILLLLLLDPYPTKQLRGTVHALFLSLLTDIRFKCRFAGALGIAYRPLSTLFCAGVGTEADTPLHFSVQLLTTGSLVRALGSAPATEKLLLSDKEENKDPTEAASIGVFASPIGHTIVRCIHTNLLGATKEVNMILNNTYSGNVDDDSPELGRQQQQGNDGLLPALTYVAGEHPLMTLLPAAPDDGFLDSRSTRHKRLPHLLRDLEYVIETPGTAMRLLLSHRFPVYQGPSLSFRGEDVLAFSSVFARMLRLAQGMDPQKRKISGGHVEYEQNRWLEAFGLSLNLSGTRDALAESPATSNAILAISSSNGTGDDAGSHLLAFREAMGNLVASLLRELKLWLYREGMLETGLPIPSGGPHGAMDLAQVEALQRSTLHVTGVTSVITDGSNPTGTNMVALSCATGVKMTETQLSLIESALKAEGAERLHRSSELGHVSTQVSAGGTVMGDWLRVPHSPLAGDSLSFHLPLHRGLAKSVRSICSAVVPQDIRNANPNNWWKIPVLDEEKPAVSSDVSILPTHPLVPLIRSTLRSSNCRVVWTSGPDCSPQEAQRRRSRSRNVAANIAVAKVIHSLADHPIRCLAAAQQIERHLWARNGSSVAGMAVNYTSTPLCRSFRDLDLLLVQLSASGMSVGLGSRRIFSLLLSRFTMDGYLCDPEKRSHMSSSGSSSPGPYASGMNSWVNPPRLQDPDHAIVLSESFFSTMCVLVTELPPPPPASASDTIALRQSIRRELVHALASEPRSRSEAMTAAAIGVTRREDSEGSSGNSGGGGLFRTTFAEVLEEIGKQKNQGTARAASGPPAFELKPEFCDEYDPTFYHLRRQEHQHAMDVVARLRKQKWDNKDAVETHCLPLVCMPPKAHPRFLPCRLLLHLPPLDAAIRRSLLFALTGGSWLPPPEPMPLPSSASLDDSHGGDGVDSTDMAGMAGMTVSRSAGASFSQIGDVPLTTFSRRSLNSRQLNSASSFLKRQGSDGDGFAPFSKEIVAASAISFLEVLQLLTLQVHTLEECASLHRILPDLDEESRLLSSGLSINSYLSRLVWIPDSLVGEWALRPFPGGPLESKGSGQMRGSILGLLIALYEHRSDHSSELDTEDGPGDDGHGGARTLATSGLKWLLRFVSALVDGASSVGSATKSATSGVPVQGQSSSSPAKPDSGSPPWTIDEGIRSTIRAMLSDLPDLWPRARAKTPTVDSSNTKSKKDGKAAQQKIMAMMLSKQKAFAASIGPADDKVDTKMQEECIICRCDDADGENNGPLGYLGHVQGSRCIQIRSTAEATNVADTSPTLPNTYRVVGHMGCQLRETEAMDSKALTCLPKGSVVTVLKTTISPEYNILSRRVLVRHVGKNPRSPTEVLSEGWASVQSSQGYVILSPLVSLCYSNSRWGSTRPVIKQCGHAAHLKCVETHTLSLHQRAAGEQPYDGRFAANIADGEFLCPLCKQLSNILIPRDSFGSSQDDTMDTAPSDDSKKPESEPDKRPLRNLFISSRLTQRQLDFTEDLRWQALERFGDNIHQAMTVPWERISSSRKKNQQQWHPAIRKWDFEDDVGDSAEKNVKGVPRLLRQQLIAWAAIGHSAAAAEASSRGVEEVLPFGLLSQTSDPWQDFKMSSKDTHPMLLELKRTLAGASGLYEVLCLKMTNQLARRDGSSSDAPIIGSCLSDIIDGWSWFLGMSSPQKLTTELALWSEITALTAALPCHVSRDGVIPQRCEARATAGAMWAVKGVGTAEVEPGDPPVPLVIRRVIGGPANGPGIPRGWGTIDCFTASAESENRLRTPFRLGVGCAYLYVPMLAWDLCTLAGALFSSVLVNDLKDLPTSEELLHIARVLTTARIVQAMITPGGIQLPDEMELGDEDCWSAEEVQTQGTALARLLAHCRTIVSTKSLNAGTGLVGSIDGLVPSTVLAGVGRAVLPFARSLVLIVRGTSAIIRERSQRSGVSARKSVAADTLLDQFICNSDIMEAEDGFHVLRALEAPPPLALIDNSSPWLSLINRWLVAVVGLELHHGSVGRSLLPSILPHATQKEAAPDALAPAKMPSKSSDAAKRPSDEQDRAVDRDEDMADVYDAGAAQFHQHPALVELMEDVDNIDVEEIGVDEVDDMDEDEEEMVGFAEQMLGAPGLSLNSLQDETGESGDENSESGSEDENRGVDREFAHVSRSPILLYQPSLLGVEEIGPGMNGVSFEYAAASAVMSDLSHLGSIHRKSEPTFSLVRLPKSFVELYNIVNIIKGREDITAGDDTEDVGSTETAICLLTGAVMRSGSSRRSAYNRTLRPPGACTLHARTNGSGIGIFFLVQKCTVLLMHNNKSAYSPSIYVDEHGEEDPGLRRGRPLFLNDARYRALELLWRQQSIPREVAQIRSTSDRVIRDNWY